MRGSRRETAPPPQPSPPSELHHSPALERLIQWLHRRPRPAVLDLGPPLSANVDFLSRRVVRLTIADLADSAARRVAGLPGGAELLREPLPCPPEGRYDAILIWDLLNYMEREEAARFVDRLRTHCRPGAHLLALVWTEPEIPARPLRFRIEDAAHLRYDHTTRGRRAAPGHLAADVERIFRGFETAAAVLLRHHVQEYLWTRSG